MAEEQFQEKSEPATGKKRGDARSRGQVAKSMELNSAFIIVCGLALLYFTGAALTTGLADIIRTCIVGSGTVRITTANLPSYVSDGLGKTAMLLGPLLAGLMVIGVGTNYAQVGFVFTVEPFKPSWDKMNPFGGLKRIFVSVRSLVELAKNFVKLAVVGTVAYAALDAVLSEAMLLIDGDAGSVLGFMARSSLSVGVKTGIAFLALAVLDFYYQRFEFDRSMRMTKQEVRDESKQLEGDPLIKSRIRATQRRIAYKRMMHEVPKADVVVTNPTHVAVALKYDAGTMAAPKVVAKGAELIAKRIKEIALANDVPVVEDKPLARALYKSVEIGDQVPEKLFQAVAQVLAYIYRLRNMKPNFDMN